MTLEELSTKIIDDWRDGNYTKAYGNDGNYAKAYEGEECMLNGSEMRDIFIKEARTKAEASEPGDLGYHADQLEETIDCLIDDLNSKFR